MKDWKRIEVNSESIDEEIDPNNILEGEKNGCKIRLFFKKEPTPNMPDMVLDMILHSFDRRVRSKIENLEME